ncbi:Outer membrane protein W [compost metagenome]
MKHLKTMTTFCMVAATLHPCCVRAQSAGSFVTTLGASWLDFPNSRSQPIVSSSVFGTFTSPGTNTVVHNAVMPSMLFTYFITDHLAVEGAVAVPPKLEVGAQGNVAAFGVGGPVLPLGEIQPLFTVRAWAPIVVAKYYFGGTENKIRPFLGVGVNYSWFRSVQLNPLFSGALSQLAGPGGSVEASLSSSWNPVLAAGWAYRINVRWMLTGSMTWFPLKTNASFNAVNANGQVVLSNRTRMSAAPLIVNVGVGYEF